MRTCLGTGSSQTLLPAAHRGLVLDSRRSLPPAVGVAWRSVRGCTGRVGRGSPRSSGSSSSTSRSSCAFIRRGSPRRTVRCGWWWSACCAGSSNVGSCRTASQGPNVRPAARATWSRFLAGGETSARHVRKRSSSYGPSGCRRKCSSPCRIVMSSSPCRASCAGSSGTPEMNSGVPFHGSGESFCSTCRNAAPRPSPST